MSEDSVCSRTICAKISLCPLGLCWLAAVYFSRTVALSSTNLTDFLKFSDYFQQLCYLNSICVIQTGYLWKLQWVHTEFHNNWEWEPNSDQWSFHWPIQEFEKWDLIILKLKAKSRPRRWSITCLKCSRLHLWNRWGDNLLTFYKSTCGFGPWFEQNLKQ